VYIGSVIADSSFHCWDQWSEFHRDVFMFRFSVLVAVPLYMFDDWSLFMLQRGVTVYFRILIVIIKWQ
jgi:hypothetical protein